MKSLWMLAASFLFSAMAVFVKMGAEDFGSLELIFYRSLAGVIMLYGFICAKGYTIRTKYLFGHFKRSFIGTFSMSLWFISLTMLPVGTSMTLNYTSPLFMAVFIVIGALLKREKLPWGLLGSIVLGFAGVVLVLRPSFDDGQLLGALLALSSGLLGSIAYWQIKELGQLHEPSWRIVFYFTLFGTFYGLIGNALFEGGLSPITTDNVIYLLGMAVCATLAQCSLTMAFGQGNLLLSSCLQFSAIVFAEIMGLVFFGDILSLTTDLGIAVIIVSGVIATVLAKKKS
ncbi:MAG TPA: DMT family transporter [Candidatus Aphodousia gallistercoris]|nr:DMT family transporter [Candidatus Aphodousia gallistercoris]